MVISEGSERRRVDQGEEGVWKKKKLPRGYYYNRLKQKNLITNLNDKQKGPIDCLTDRGTL